MPVSIRSFDRMIIPAPCPADWDSMIGNDEVRFCGHCNLHVTNLSNMTRQEAMRLVARSEGRLCVRFVKRDDGGVLSKRTLPKLHHIARRVSRMAAGAFTATLSLSSAAAQTDSRIPQTEQLVHTVRKETLALEAFAILSGTITDPYGAVIPGA